MSMSRNRRWIILGTVLLAMLLGLRVSPRAQSPSGPAARAGTAPQAITVAPAGDLAVRDWSSQVDRMARDGDLRARSVQPDTLLPGRTHERLDQFYKGVRVFGGDLTRQLDGSVAVSVFGVLYQGIDLDPSPALSIDDARAAIERITGVDLGSNRSPDLVILPRDAGGYALTYRAQVWTNEGLIVLFIDANTGAEVSRYNNLQSQSAIRAGKGVLNDDKKVSMKAQSGTYVADDQLRPPVLVTFDMKGNLARTKAVLNGQTALTTSDLGSSPADVWTDGAAVDAHTYQGWTYDYYLKRFGRRGLDDKNTPIVGLVHPVLRANFNTVSQADFGSFVVNAFWNGAAGAMVYGDGLPTNLTLSGQQWNFLAGGLDVVAHELTHGVTQFTSSLIYKNESGALNEAFSDMMGTSVEFFFASVRGRGGNYVIGEDVVTPGGLRSMGNPASTGDPDHYTRRYTGFGDNGGVHTNSAIPNQVFFLAIEGGTNRTSGRAVQGVGSANREQIEKVFYRAFTLLLPSGAGFATARAATLQSARDLYGTGGAVERAIGDAWDALGVFQQADLDVSYSPSPATGRTTQCGTLTPPCWAFTVTVQELANVAFTVDRTTINFFDDDGVLINTGTVSFSQFFASCGPGSARVPARGRACSTLAVSLGGRRGGFVQFVFDGRDDGGRSITFGFQDVLRLAPAAAAQLSVSGTAFSDPEVLLDR